MTEEIKQETIPNDLGITPDQNDLLVNAFSITNEMADATEEAKLGKARLELLKASFTEQGIAKDMLNLPYFQTMNTNGTWNEGAVKNPQHLYASNPEALRIGKKEDKPFCTATVEQALDIRKAIFKAFDLTYGDNNGTRVSAIYDMNDAERKTVSTLSMAGFDNANKQSHHRLRTLQNTIFPKKKEPYVKKTVEDKITTKLQDIGKLLGELEVIKSKKFTIDDLQVMLKAFNSAITGKTSPKKK